MTISNFKETAKNRLQGQWLKMAAFIFLIAILTTVVQQVSTVFNSESARSLAAFILLCTIGFAFSYAQNFLGLYVARGGKADISMLFVVFQKPYYSKMLFVHLISQIVQYVIGLVIFIPILLSSGMAVYLNMLFGSRVTQYTVDSVMSLGFASLAVILLLLYLVIGVVISVLFNFAVWVSFDYPELSLKECFARAWYLMKDRWGKYILLQLSFIGWFILGFIALFVGVFFAAAYAQTASAAFYDQAVKEKLL
ncbi:MULTISPECIES: DUF975 family protein [Enterococcus]|uniref:DUF975 family protein n=1 Tax=Enterococcus alishanensis TaxID=1303817 RepID=A0ABS6T8U5_9ENTE|nr:DUF975 family protein [Enterococcus alishanensis]MBV7389326.1 DUF975 family protein [Enterococcus alishanensis]